MKPEGWPRYMTAKPLARGATAYYWAPRPADRKAGCKLEPRALGTDYGRAVRIADELNRALDQWRAGKGGVPQVRAYGSVDWWLHVYRTRTRAWEKLSERSKGEYGRHLRIVAEVPTTDDRRFGNLPVTSITPRAVDRLYQRLKPGRLRQAHFELDILKKAWRAVQRLHPAEFPAGNPFEGLERDRRGTATKRPATFAEALALAEALRAIGHPHLGAAALICFEWLQRPENLLGGALTWPDYQPGAAVRIEHWKTHEEVELDLADADGPLFPELEACLAGLERLGTPIVLYRERKGQARLYKRRHAHAIVARARKAAELPDHVTLAACRHGGLTELGNAEVTEAEGMALSGHQTPSAFRLYVKKTGEQRRSALRKRRDWRRRSA